MIVFLWRPVSREPSDARGLTGAFGGCYFEDG